MKVFTLNGYFNYGNRLQAFAMAKVLKKFSNEIGFYWPRNLKEMIKETLKYYTPLRFKYRKELKLKKFTKKHTPLTFTYNDIVSIIGSDQVWNPDYFKNAIYLLNGNPSGMNVSYAASMGIETLTNEQKELFRKALKNYKAISVREKTAKELLQPLTDKKIEVVLDPTLLLDEAEYKKIEKKPRDIKLGEKYVLCYILGSPEHQKIIEDFADKNGYPVIMFSDKKNSSYGVEEFLYLVRHAELICTDSFHASVFSFIFDRPLLIFKRSGVANYMYSRLQNLVDTFKLTSCQFDGARILEENLSVDYTDGKKILKKEREKSLKFLKDALEGCND